MSEINLWLIRHGESKINAGHWSANPHHVALTEKGEQQAKQAAQQVVSQPDLLIYSPAKRAQDSTLPIIARWPGVVKEIWPIQEFVYLSPKRYQDKTTDERRSAIENYWHQANPFFCDGDDAESFSHFIKRVQDFYYRILMQQGYIVVVGHGQFFKAYQLGLAHGFASTSDWMSMFRQQETTHPIANSEIIKIIIDKL